MGNTGVDHPNIEYGDHHVHYQMWDPTGNRVNPAEFWDRRDAPAYLREYQQYLHGLDANAGSGFGDAPDAATTPTSRLLGVSSNEPRLPYTNENFRYLGRRVVGNPDSSVFETGSPAVSFVPSNSLSPDRKNSFDDRFGSRTARSVAPSNESLSPSRQNSFDSRFGNWSSSPAGFTPRKPTLPVPQPDPGTPRVDGSSPMGGLAGRIAALAGIDPDNPDQPVPSAGGLLALLLAAQR